MLGSVTTYGDSNKSLNEADRKLASDVSNLNNRVDTLESEKIKELEDEINSMKTVRSLKTITDMITFI